jgi:hypothetical protein
MHQAQSFPKLDGLTSQAIWWWHAQILNANQKTQAAREAIDRAYDFLLESIANIRDEGLRRNALNKVEDSRKLLQFWVRDGVKRKLPNERLFAHLTIQSNLRDPFKRLANTSLRLNTLKTVREIQNFLVEEATELSGGERVMLILENDGKTEVADSLFPREDDAGKVLKSIGKHIAQARLTRTGQLILPSNRQSKINNQKSKIRQFPFRFSRYSVILRLSVLRCMPSRSAARPRLPSALASTWAMNFFSNSRCASS